MSKAQDKKKVTVIEETAALPAVENKAADEVVTEVTVVKEKPVEAAPFLKAPWHRNELGEQTEEVSVKLAELSAIELDKITSTTLKSVWGYSDNNQDDAGSSLIINGEKIEPQVKGIKGHLNQILETGRGFGFDYRFDRCASWTQLQREEKQWDVYVYALELSNKDRFRDGGMITSLRDRLSQTKLFQVLVIEHGSRVELNDKLRMPSMWDSARNSLTGGPGVMFVMGSDLTNVISMKDNVIQGQTWEDVIVDNSRAIAGDIYRGTLKGLWLKDSSLIAVNANGTEKPFGRNSIRKSTLQDVRITDVYYNIVKSELKDCSVSGKSANIGNSRLTGIHLSAKGSIEVKNTGCHHTRSVQFRSNGNIEVNSIYDLTVVQASERLMVTLVNGGESFWLGIDGADEYGNSVYEVGKTAKRSLLEEEDRRGYRPWRMPQHFSSDNHDEQMELYIGRAVQQSLGAGELANTISRHVTSTLRDRIGVARTVASVKKLEAPSYSHGW